MCYYEIDDKKFFIAICSIIFCPYNLQGQNGVSLETKLVHKLTLVADSLTKHLKPWIVPVLYSMYGSMEQ